KTVTAEVPTSSKHYHRKVVPQADSDDDEGDDSDNNQERRGVGTEPSEDDAEDEAESPEKVAMELFSEFPEVASSKIKGNAKVPSSRRGHSRHSSMSSIWTTGGAEEPIASDMDNYDSDVNANAKIRKQSLPKSTVRERKLAAEAPSWNDNSEASASAANQDDDQQDFGTDNEDNARTVDPVDIQLIPNPKGGEYRLTDQKPEIRKVVRGAIIYAKAYMCFEHAYPELITQNMYARDALVLTARDLQYGMIENRLTRDAEYATILAHLVSLLHLLDKIHKLMGNRSQVEARVPLTRTDAKDLAFAQ
ncbi:hypothetical protein BV22DRAFT_1052860, partial [Leucogyrophana mollusca]